MWFFNSGIFFVGDLWGEEGGGGGEKNKKNTHYYSKLAFFA